MIGTQSGVLSSSQAFQITLQVSSISNNAEPGHKDIGKETSFANNKHKISRRFVPGRVYTYFEILCQQRLFAQVLKDQGTIARRPNEAHHPQENAKGPGSLMARSLLVPLLAVQRKGFSRFHFLLSAPKSPHATPQYECASSSDPSEDLELVQARASRPGLHVAQNFSGSSLTYQGQKSLLLCHFHVQRGYKAAQKTDRNFSSSNEKDVSEPKSPIHFPEPLENPLHNPSILFLGKRLVYSTIAM